MRSLWNYLYIWISRKASCVNSFDLKCEEHGGGWRLKKKEESVAKYMIWQNEIMFLKSTPMANGYVPIQRKSGSWENSVANNIWTWALMWSH